MNREDAKNQILSAFKKSIKIDGKSIDELTMEDLEAEAMKHIGNFGIKAKSFIDELKSDIMESIDNVRNGKVE